MSNEGKVQVAVEENHLRLDRSIDNISSVTSKANTLLNRVRNNNCDGEGKGEGCDKNEPTLQEILVHGSRRIDKEVEEIHCILDEITRSLYEGE